MNKSSDSIDNQTLVKLKIQRVQSNICVQSIKYIIYL